MITRYTHGSLVWVDIENPTQEEVRSVMDEFEIAPVIAEEFLVPTLRPRVDIHKNYVYLILHFPMLSGNVAGEQEIDFVIGRHFIVTARYDTVEGLHTFEKLFERHTLLHHEADEEHAGFIFVGMLRQLYGSVLDHLSILDSRLKEVEENIFEDREREMVFELSFMSRELLHFKRALTLHKEMLHSFETAAHRFFNEDFDPHLEAVMSEYYRTAAEVNAHLDTVNELRDTNNSLLTTKQNEITKTLTIMAFVTFPLTLIAAIFGMNTEHLPVVGLPGDFWIVIGAMAVLTASFFLYFKYKRWL